MTTSENPYGPETPEGAQGGSAPDGPEPRPAGQDQPLSPYAASAGGNLPANAGAPGNDPGFAPPSGPAWQPGGYASETGRPQPYGSSGPQAPDGGWQSAPAAPYSSPAYASQGDTRQLYASQGDAAHAYASQGDPSHAYAGAGAWPQTTATRTATRPRRLWPSVILSSATAAVLATGVTLGVVNATGAFDREPATTSDSTPVVPTSNSGSTGVEQVAAAVRDSVVAIQVSTRSGTGAGSGVIVDSSGNILTNFHVVEGATTIQVTLADGRLFEAEVVGTDPTTDLAVIALRDAPDDLSPAQFGDSGQLQVGQEVVAVGNPLGLSSTVTSGIVSALDRPVTTQSSGGDAVVTNAIQVDAAINPGNSGGPLFNMQGQVIGINSSIASLSSGMGGSSGSIGLGFAIPSSLAERISEEIIANGSATHAFLGVSMETGTATVDGVMRTGAGIVSVVPGSSAANAGLQPGDLIVSVDGKLVGGPESLTGHVRALAPGTDVVLGVVRGGQLNEVTVTLGTAE